MGRTDYTKVEDILSEGLRKMTVESLLSMADAASGKQSTEAKANIKSFTSALERQILWVYKKDDKLFKNLKLDKKKLKDLLQNPDKLSKEDLSYLHEVKEKLGQYKLKNLPQRSDEELVEDEKDRHINKRFNVQEKWLPLK